MVAVSSPAQPHKTNIVIVAVTRMTPLPDQLTRVACFSRVPYDFAVEGAHILLTGGAGFIGSHLVERLARKNRIRVLDTFRRDALRPAGLHELPGVELMEGDVMDPASVKRAMDGVD